MDLDIENDRLKFLLEYVTVGVLSINKFEKIEYVNNTLANWLYYTKNELLRLELKDININSFEDILADTNRNTESFRSVFRRKDESAFPVEITIIQDENIEKSGLILYVKDITEEKNKEDYIKKLNATLDSSSDAVYWGNNEGAFVYVNDKACEMLGYSKEEFKNLTIFDIDKNFKESDLESGLNDSIDNKQDHNLFIETYHLKKNGERIPVEVNSTRVWVNSEWFVLSFVRDISIRKKRERELLKNEKLFKEAQRIAKIGTWELNILNNTLEWSDEVFSMFGYERGELGKSFSKFSEIIPAEDAIKVKKIIEKIARDKCFYDHEHRVIKKDGDIIFVNVAGDVVFNDHKEVVRIFGVVQDITERKKSEKALIESEKRMLRIFDVAPVGLGIVKNRIIIKLNIFACQITGYSENELIGAGSQILYPNINEYSRVGQLLYKKIDQKGIGYVETIWKRKDGKIINILLGSALIDPEDASKGIIATSIDITERKLIQKQLLEAKEKAEQSDRLKSAFLANMSHEIRTPMNAIIGFASFLKEEDLSKEDHDKYVDIIMTSGELLLALINDIIDISKVDSGQMDIVKVDVKLNCLLEEIYSFFQSYLVSKNKTNIVLKLDIPDEEIIVYTDEMRLKQILINLIGNAVKFTNKGFIKIACKKEGDFVKFSIHDTGIGIPDEKKELIFERFQQGGDATEKNYGGTGLGLAIAKACVELLGGSISLKSEIGKGTTFYFSIITN